jgi:hypothetical protein
MIASFSSQDHQASSGANRRGRSAMKPFYPAMLEGHVSSRAVWSARTFLCPTEETPGRLIHRHPGKCPRRRCTRLAGRSRRARAGGRPGRRRAAAGRAVSRIRAGRASKSCPADVSVRRARPPTFRKAEQPGRQNNLSIGGPGRGRSRARGTAPALPPAAEGALPAGRHRRVSRPGPGGTAAPGRHEGPAEDVPRRADGASCCDGGFAGAGGPLSVVGRTLVPERLGPQRALLVRVRCP